MGKTDDSADPVLSIKPMAMGLLLLLLAIEVLRVAALFHQKASGAVDLPLIDFDVFHIVGRMHWLGTLAEAHSFILFQAHQKALTGTVAFMPWTYPPPFSLLVAPLGLLPAWLAYFLFVSATLAAYLAVLRRLAGPQLGAVLVALLPVLFVTILCGQNGFLSGALVGLFALLSRRGSPWAGLPLGLMVIKPHLAVGLGVHLLLTRGWVALALAAAAAVVAAGASTLALGPGIWPAFLHGVAESGAFLEAGAYPLQRMTSVYAGLRSLGVEAHLALGAHLAVATCALAMVGAAVARGWRADRTLAVAVLATLLVSPYNYDYDLPILGVALALAFRAIPNEALRRAFPAVLALALFAGGYPAAVTMSADSAIVEALLTVNGKPVALSPFAVVALAALLGAMMWAAERAGQGGSRTDEPRAAPVSQAQS